MPLSEHEQRLLDQIEQALYADDPKFAATVRSARSRSRSHPRRMLAVADQLTLDLPVATEAATRSATGPAGAPTAARQAVTTKDSQPARSADAAVDAARAKFGANAVRFGSFVDPPGRS